WVAERKDVLSTLFGFAAILAYSRYTVRRDWRLYLLTAILFATGLLAKSMLVTLPFVLLLLDGWPLGRLSVTSLPRRVWEKVPLLGMSAASSAITYLAQAKGGAVIQFEHLPFGSRLSNALVSYVVYLGKAVWPSSLAVFYPHPATVHAEVPAWWVAGAILLLCGFSIIALRAGPRRPYLAVGWLWYVGGRWFR
ncbi:MAG TPA: hypothetical protein VF827_10660, partial [Syntrophales bacterium]